VQTRETHLSHIVVLGAGAIGGQTVAHLTRAGEDVVMVDPWFKHVYEVNRNGLHITRPGEDFVAPVRALHLDELWKVGPIDVMMLALKSYDTEWAVRYAAPYLSSNGYIVSLQNGVNEERIAKLVGRERTVGASVHLGGYFTSPGQIDGTTDSSWAAFSIGELDGRITARVSELGERLDAVGKVDVTDDIWAALWSKLTLNVMTNALAGLSGLSTPKLWTDARALDLLVHLAGETLLAAQSRKIAVGALHPPGASSSLSSDKVIAAHKGDRNAFAEVCAHFAATAAARTGKRENKSSLLQDVLRGRRTEVDYLNGYVVQVAAESRIATPVNSAVIRAVHELEEGTLEQGPEVLETIQSRIEAAGGGAT
jgi:2-dehydropantoate 2-reductase